MSAMDIITQIAGQGASPSSGGVQSGSAPAGAGAGAAALFQSALSGFLAGAISAEQAASAGLTAQGANGLNVNGLNINGPVISASAGNAVGAQPNLIAGLLNQNPAAGQNAVGIAKGQITAADLEALASLSPEDLASALMAQGVAPETVTAAAQNLQANLQQLAAQASANSQVAAQAGNALTLTPADQATLTGVGQALGAKMAETAALMRSASTAQTANGGAVDGTAQIDPAISDLAKSIASLVNGGLLGAGAAGATSQSADEAAALNPQALADAVQRMGLPVAAPIKPGIKPQVATVTPAAGSGADDGNGNALQSGNPSTNNLVAALATKATGASANGAGNLGANASNGAASNVNISASALAALNAQNSADSATITLGKGEFSRLSGPMADPLLQNAPAPAQAHLQPTSTQQVIAAGLGTLSGDSITLGKIAPQITTPPHYTSAGIANNVGMQISKSMMAGQTEFTIRIDPPELGRVNVKMHFGQDGTLRAMIQTDTREAMQLLQREQGVLERALEQAGAKLDQGGLNFSLKDGKNDGQQAHNEQNSSGANDGEFSNALMGEDDITAEVMPYVDADRALDIRI